MMVLVTALVVWAAAGVIIAAILARYGHNFWLFALMGLGYGPFLVLVWLKGARGQQTQSVMIRAGSTGSSAGWPDDGWLDVLVGLDGSDHSVCSTRHVLETLRPAIRRVRLTSALDHEISNQPDAFSTDERRSQYLKQAANTLGYPDAEIVLLSGQPDKALLDHAEQDSFDLLVIAHRAEGIVTTLQGSTASRLVRRAEIPVLIGPPA